MDLTITFKKIASPRKIGKRPKTLKVYPTSLYLFSWTISLYVGNN